MSQGREIFSELQNGDQKEIARVSGLSWSYVNKIVNGHRDEDLSTDSGKLVLRVAEMIITNRKNLSL